MAEHDEADGMVGGSPEQSIGIRVAADDPVQDNDVRGLRRRPVSGNVTESARLAKRNRTDFYKLLSRYRLRPDAFKSVQA